jgi:hypothetical protein
MNKTMRSMISAAALVAATAIPSSFEAQSVDGADATESKTIAVNVENRNWHDMRIYAVREGGASWRIGTVTSSSTQTLELPSWFSTINAEVHLVAVPIGSYQRYAAPPVVASGGDVIELKLRNNLALSSIWLRAG